jgi:Hint domain/Bacterial Ig-like domain/Right handed beta helix region
MATTYYVSSEIGNNNNAGTSESAPLATLQAAADLVRPGDTIEVMNGTYTGPAGGDVLDITTSGTAAAPITIEAAPGQNPVINSSGCWQGINIEASYIVVNGVTVVGDAANYTLSQALAGNSTSNPSLDGNGIEVVGTAGTTNTANHVTIENCTVYNEPGAGIGTQFADYVTIQNNVVYDNAHWSAFGQSGISLYESVASDTNPGVHSVISGNIVFGNSQLVPTQGSSIVTDGEGIILDTNNAYNYQGIIEVENNLVYNNGSSGIESYATNNAVITGNTSFNNDTQNVQSAANAEIFNNGSSNNTISGNTLTVPTLTPPAAPVIAGDSVGFGNTVTLHGTGQIGSTITVYDNSAKLGTTVVNANGDWIYASGDLAAGNQSFVVKATDAAGNVSPQSSPPVTVTLNSAANLVQNGNFATGTFADWTLGGNYQSSQSGTEIFIENANTEGGSAYAAGLGSVGADGTLSQTIATTPGQSYTLSFWLQNDGGSPNDFSAIWNGKTLLSLTNSNPFAYTEYTYTVTATTSSTTLEFSAANGPAQWDLDNISLTAPTCYMRGTLIATPTGDVPIEELSIGDPVLTLSGDAKPIKWIGRRTVSTQFADPLRALPIRIKANALSINVPSRDLLLSPDHALFIDGVLVHAGALVNASSIVRETDVPARFTYYHVELDDHALIVAENTPAESFIDNVDYVLFDNWQEYVTLYPQGRSIIEMPYPRAKAYRQVPRTIRERLAARAAVICTRGDLAA